jgi:hypothetical protein
LYGSLRSHASLGIGLKLVLKEFNAKTKGAARPSRLRQKREKKKPTADKKQTKTKDNASVLI